MYLRVLICLVPDMYALYVRLIRVPYMHASTCASLKAATWCLICMTCMHALYACLTCTPYTYALYACHLRFFEGGQLVVLNCQPSLRQTGKKKSTQSREFFFEVNAQKKKHWQHTTIP